MYPHTQKRTTEYRSLNSPAHEGPEGVYQLKPTRPARHPAAVYGRSLPRVGRDREPEGLDTPSLSPSLPPSNPLETPLEPLERHRTIPFSKGTPSILRRVRRS